MITRVGPAMGTKADGSEVMLFLVQAEVGGELLHVAASADVKAHPGFHDFVWRSAEVVLRRKIRDREERLNDHA
ncbi:MAG: hypothetical protein EHM91_12770 [Planctomycetota bacterium]|nr:MAG: hypothetical protein EHM91_12770 [Planctomycetota bacterium]